MDNHQLQKTDDCWLFLNCEVMTGSAEQSSREAPSREASADPAKKCPNRKACKQNALHSPNRKCDLPYEIFDPELGDQLFECRTMVVSVFVSEEAVSAGWDTAIGLEASKLFLPTLNGRLKRQA